MKKVLFILALFCSIKSKAQDINKLPEKKLSDIYDSQLDFLFNNKNKLIGNLNFSSGDFNNIFRLRQNKQRFINSLTDSVSKKRLLVEEINDLFSLQENVDNISFVNPFLTLSNYDVEEYIKTLDSLNKTVGLEKCKKCALARDVEFVVLNRLEDGSLDTLRCLPATHYKVNFRNDTLSKTTFDTYQCNALLKNISLTGAYSKNLVSVKYKGQVITKSFIVNAGKSENDILVVPIIINEDK